jgi:hypothetical protein
MDWKQLGEAAAKIGLPLLGAALPIPGGAALGAALASAIGSKSASPEDILATLTGNAEALAKARQFELEHQEKILALVLDYEKSVQANQSSVIISEAKGESFLQRNWRPITMLWFCIIIAMYWFGVSPPNATEAVILELFGIIKLGLGGYTIGRSGEKIAATIGQYMGAKNGQ